MYVCPAYNHYELEPGMKQLPGLEEAARRRAISPSSGCDQAARKSQASLRATQNEREAEILLRSVVSRFGAGPPSQWGFGEPTPW